MEKFGAGHEFTYLIPPLEGQQDPDDAFSSVPYEKGSCFLYYLESLIGIGGEFMQTFCWMIKDWYDH